MKKYRPEESRSVPYKIGFYLGLFLIGAAIPFGIIVCIGYILKSQGIIE